MGGKKQDNLGEKIDDVLEIVNFLKDNAVMRDEFETRMNRVESQMVTKEYLDDKMADLRGDLVVMMRKEDNKLKTLLEILQSRKVITKVDATKVMAMEPFAQLAIQ